MSDEIITVNQAADRLGITPVRVRQLIKAGRLPAQPFGERSYVIKASDLKLVANRPTGRPPKAKPETKSKKGKKSA